MNDNDLKEDLWGYAKRLRFVREAIADAFPTERGEITVLDVGCGTGSQLGIPLARLGYKLTGIDMHEPSIVEACRTSRDLANAKFICGSVDELDSNAFDVVILSEVLEHVPGPESLLRESLTKLKDNGLMIVTVPNGFGEFEWDSWVFRGLGLERLVEKHIEKQAAKGDVKDVVSSTENSDNRHIQFFTLGRLNAMFEKAGLRIERRQASTIMSGPFAGHTIARIPGFIDWNASFADRLPMSFSSGWFFALRRTEVSK